MLSSYQYSSLKSCSFVVFFFFFVLFFYAYTCTSISVKILSDLFTIWLFCVLGTRVHVAEIQ